MNKPETVKLLMIIKGIWQEQSTGDETIAAWSKLLETVKFWAAQDAVMLRARAGMDRPSAAQVCHSAVEQMGRRADKEESMRRARALNEPEPSPEQKQRNLEILRQAAAGIGRRMEG